MSTQQKVTAFAYDASQTPPSSALDPLPIAWYNCEITDAEVLATKGKTGGIRTQLEFTVVDGEYQGRKFWGSYNTKNANAQAAEIGNREFSTVLHYVGCIVISDLTVLIGRRLQVKTKIKAAEGEYDAKTEPKYYKALDGATGAAPTPPGAGAPPPPPGAGAPPPPPVTAAPPAPPAPVAVFPPAGWQQNGATDWYYEIANPTNQVQEAGLRAMSAPPAPPIPAPAPPPPPAPAPPPPPAPAPVATFPPEGWTAHPTSPGYFYQGQDVKSEAELRAMSAPPAPPASSPPPPPAAPTGGVEPPTGGVEPPPWKRPAA